MIEKEKQTIQQNMRSVPMPWAGLPWTGSAEAAGLRLHLVDAAAIAAHLRVTAGTEAGDAGAEGGSHISREYVITVETAAWPGLNRSEVVVITSPIGGIASYKLRSDLVQQDDGVFSTVKPACQ